MRIASSHLTRGNHQLRSRFASGVSMSRWTDCSSTLDGYRSVSRSR